MQDFSISIANALEILQSCTKPVKYVSIFPQNNSTQQGILYKSSEGCLLHLSSWYVWQPICIDKYIMYLVAYSCVWAKAGQLRHELLSLQSSYKLTGACCVMEYHYIMTTYVLFSVDIKGSFQTVKGFKHDVPCIVRWHKGARRISQCTRHIVPSALTYPSSPWVPPISQCTVHHA